MKTQHQHQVNMEQRLSYFTKSLKIYKEKNKYWTKFKMLQDNKSLFSTLNKIIANMNTKMKVKRMMKVKVKRMMKTKIIMKNKIMEKRNVKLTNKVRINSNIMIMIQKELYYKKALDRYINRCMHL